MLNADESFSSEGTSADPRPPHHKESSVSRGVTRRQRLCSVDECSEESGGLDPRGQGSPDTEVQQRHALAGSDEKPKISCVWGKAPGNGTAHQCNNAGETAFSSPERDTTSSLKRSMKSHKGAHAGEEGFTQDQSTSLQSEAEQHHTKRAAPCQTVC